MGSLAFYKDSKKNGGRAGDTSRGRPTKERAQEPSLLGGSDELEGGRKTSPWDIYLREYGRVTEGLGFLVKPVRDVRVVGGEGHEAGVSTEEQVVQ